MRPTDIGVLVVVLVTAIAVAVIVSTSGQFTAATNLDTSLENLKSTSQQVQQAISPIPLDSSPKLTQEQFNKLVTEGVLVATGPLLALSIDKLRELIAAGFYAVASPGSVRLRGRNVRTSSRR